MQRLDSICVSKSVFSFFCYQLLVFEEMFQKYENAVQWAINLASMSYQSIVCS